MFSNKHNFSIIFLSNIIRANDNVCISMHFLKYKYFVRILSVLYLKKFNFTDGDKGIAKSSRENYAYPSVYIQLL